MELFLKSKFKLLLSLFILGLACFLIIFNFTKTPNVWVDEGVFTNVAENLSVNHSVGMQISPGVSKPLGLLLSAGYPVIFPVSLSFKFFDVGLWQARLVMVIYMIILVILFFIFSNKLYGFYPAVLSSLLLLSFSPFYGNGRPVQGEVPGLVFLVFGAILLLYWEKSEFKNSWYLALSGFTLAVSASVKPLYLLVITASLLLTFIFWFKKINNKSILINFLLGVVPPAILWFLFQFNGVHSDDNIFSTYLSFASYFIGNHSSDISVWQNIYTNLLRFLTESTPLLFIILLALTTFVFILRFFKKIDRDISISEFFILTFIVLNWLGYLKGTGWYRYFFPANTLVYIFVPFVFWGLGGLFVKPIYKKILVFAPVVLLLFQFYHLVFISDTSYVVKRTRNDDLKKVLSEIDPSKKVLFYNASEAIVFLNSNNYYQYLSMEGFLEVGSRDYIADKTFDYILVDNSLNIDSLSKCYEKIIVSRYYLLKKNNKCT